MAYPDAKPDVGVLKKARSQNVAAGEKLIGAEFRLIFHGYEDLTVLVRSAQFPRVARKVIEDNGPMGTQARQYGVTENAGEITVTCVETIKGDVLAAIRKIVRNKEYVDITMEATPESTGRAAPESLVADMEECLLACDAIDFATDDAEALVKPSITITYNNFEA